MECFLTTEQEAIAFLRERGYRVTKPTVAKAPEPPAPKLNAVGKPYGASYDPNYRMKYRRNVIAELCRPYDRRHHGPSFVSDAQCERMIAAWKASGTWARDDA